MLDSHLNWLKSQSQDLGVAYDQIGIFVTNQFCKEKREERDRLEHEAKLLHDKVEQDARIAREQLEFESRRAREAAWVNQHLQLEAEKSKAGKHALSNPKDQTQVLMMMMIVHFLCLINRPYLSLMMIQMP